jgi:hypothetical protein
MLKKVSNAVKIIDRTYSHVFCKPELATRAVRYAEKPMFTYGISAEGVVQADRDLVVRIHREVDDLPFCMVGTG